MNQLFFLPFAGASINSYLPLIRALAEDFECIPIELPGRGSQFGDQLLESVHDMAEFCIKRITEKRNEASWGIFGHSLGAVLATLVCGSEKVANDQPQWIILSGRAAPGIQVTHRLRHQLTKEDLFQDLKQLGGFDTELFNHPELLNLIEPVLRADFKAIETFDFNTVPMVKVPILVLGGSLDEIKKHQLDAWSESTHSTCETVILDGGHFFIFQHINTIAQIIRDRNRTSE
jgi:surfactin synthase thioesterase subunit